MANKTIGQLTLATSALDADLIEFEIASSGISRKITKANFIGATLTGAGTIATGGFTLTVPRTGIVPLPQVVLISNNAAVSLNVGAYAVIFLNARADDTVGLVACARIGASPFMAALSALSNTNVTTGTLTGTTGTNGKFTVSAGSDGLLYLENRRGGAMVVHVTPMPAV